MNLKSKDSRNTFNNLSLTRKVSLIRLRNRIKKVRTIYENKHK